MTIISLFSGAGGLYLGLIQAGNNVIWANDIDADAVATYKANINDHDAGHLRISVDGDVFLSDKARWSYGASNPPKIFIPDQINRDFLKWRWDNYNGV